MLGPCYNLYMDEKNINEKNILNYLANAFDRYTRRYGISPKYLYLTSKNFNDLRWAYPDAWPSTLDTFWGAEVLINNKTGLSCKKRKGNRIKC